MAVATDLGEWNDIHSLNKQDVGKRLVYNIDSYMINELNAEELIELVKKLKNPMLYCFSVSWRWG